MKEDLNSPHRQPSAEPPDSLQDLLEELQVGSAYTPKQFLLAVATHGVNTCKEFGDLDLLEASKAVPRIQSTLKVLEAALEANPEVEENGLTRSVFSSHLEELQSYLRLTGDSLTEDKELLVAAQEQAKIAASNLESYLPESLKPQTSAPQPYPEFNDLLNSDFGVDLREKLSLNLERTTEETVDSEGRGEGNTSLKKSEVGNEGSDIVLGNLIAVGLYGSGMIAGRLVFHNLPVALVLQLSGLVLWWQTNFDLLGLRRSDRPKEKK